MVRKARLDAELVRRGLARSRQHAVDLVAEGKVLVAGLPAHKVSTAVDPSTSLRVATAPADDVVSRGAHKLAGALAAWPDLVVEQRRCLDAGASTGGFTQVLLRRGASRVVAVDVGYGQLAWSVHSDARVRTLDRTNVRSLTPDQIGGPVDLVVADLSFISLRTVLGALSDCAKPDADMLPMVKPQFEVGRERLGSGGVVRDPSLRADAVLAVSRAARELGWQTCGVSRSRLPGPSGNVEFFLWLRREDQPAIDDATITEIVTTPAEAP
jgi:23S rRNA (cytidine1920-2'-O)/16S rRNA (cytidine1409-2'-O)-methyltransferase